MKDIPTSKVNNFVGGDFFPRQHDLYLPKHAARAGSERKPILKRRLTVLNSDFSFSTRYHVKFKEPSLSNYLPKYKS